MGFFQRFFSPEYRRALAAEAEGDFLAAARAYALCGEVGKVADMHLAHARQQREISDRIDALYNALAFVPRTDPRRPMVLRLIANALQERSQQRGAKTTEGRRDLEQAALLLEQGESWSAAADAFLALGDRERAANNYSRAGMLEKMELVLAADERDHDRQLRLDGRFRDYELYLQGGQRDPALAALRDCVAIAPDKGPYRALLEDLEARLLSRHRVDLRLGERRLTVVGRFPLLIGRDPDCALVLRGPAISREHVQLKWEAGSADFLLEDLSSRNGTWLGPLQLAGMVTLPDSALVALGDNPDGDGGGCQLQLAVIDRAGGLLRLEIRRGVDQGRLAAVGNPPIPLDRCLDRAPPLSIDFVRGRPMLEARDPTLPLFLNGGRVSGAIQLIRGDELLCDQHQLKVCE